MAIGAIEFTTISRAQDFATIKHHEDQKVVVDQSNFSTQVQKTVEQQIKQVRRGDETQWQEHRPDAKEKGNGSYAGDGGKKRKHQASVEKMVVKRQSGFDMKI